MEDGSTSIERSAGGVLWRTDGSNQLEICLIATRGSTRWQLPKGHLGAGETLADAARREIREETGCDGDVEEDLGEIAFWFFVGDGCARRSSSSWSATTAARPATTTARSMRPPGSAPTSRCDG